MFLYNMPKSSIQDKLAAYDAGVLPAIRAHFSASVTSAISKPKTRLEHLIDAGINGFQGSLRDFFNPSLQWRFLSLEEPSKNDLWEFAGWHIRNTPGVNGDMLRAAINKTMEERNISANALGLTAGEARSMIIYRASDIPFIPPG